MKKKLKVQKAALGRFARRRPTPLQPRPGVQLGTQPGFTIPTSNVGPNDPGIIPRDPGYGSGPRGTPRPPQLFVNGLPSTPNIGAMGNPIRQPGMQQSQANTFNSTPFPRGSGMQQTQPSPGFTPLSGLGNPISQEVAQQTGFGLGPRPNNFGPMQGVGDPRLGAATLPGNVLQMQMRGPQQAAPAQPVPAMKKGGVVRGGRAEIKGTRPAKLT
jgi:hypothetical protein